MLKLFLQFEFGKIRKYFRTKTLAKTITSILGLLIFLFVAFGIYSFFISGFRYINADTAEDVRTLLLLFIYEIFLLILAGIIGFSALVSGVFNLFRGQYNNWIISSPKYTLFPTFVLVRSLMTSLLPLCIVFLPAMIAFIKAYNLNATSIFFVLLSLALFLLIINLITLLFIVITGSTYYRISRLVKYILFSLKGLIVAMSVIIIVIVLFTWGRIKNIDLVQLFKAEDVDTTHNLSIISDHFKFLPTHPLAIEIINWQNKQSVEALQSVGILLLLTIVLAFVWYFISPLFYPLWLRFQEGNSEFTDSSTRIHYLFKGTKTMILFKKESLLLFRNWKGILWFLFLSCIWLAQIGANVIIGHNIQKYQPDISQKTIILQVLQYIIAIYFISSFTLRFVFPSFSVEKKTLWILGTAPLNSVKIFFGKYFFYTLFLVSLGSVMSYLNILILHVPFMHAMYSIMLFISTIILIVTLGLSIGAMFPNLESDDPEVISTSMPGLFFTAFSLIYGATTDWILYKSLEQEKFGLLILCIVITWVLVFTLLQYASRVAKYKLI